MAKNYKVVFQATIDTAQLQKEAQKALQGTSIPFNTKGMTSYGNAAKQSAGMLGEFSAQLRNLGSTIPKVAAFGAATAAIGAFTAATSSAIEAVFEMDAALVEFRKVSDLTGKALDDFVDKATEVGQSVARTGAEMIEATTMFRKSGFTDDMSLRLAEEASLFQNIADSEVSAADASSFLIATMKGFNIEAKDTRTILDQVNQVANEYAVSTTDLSTALPKVAATMSQAGNSLSETIALLTSAMEVMPNQASRIARGFRSITLNLQGMNDEGEGSQELVSKMEGDFNKLGLTLMGTDGQLKSTFEIFSDLSSVWGTLDRNTQNYFAALIGGKTQVDVVNSALTNFSTALRANETAMNSSGSATRENARYMDSLQAKLQALKSEWQALANEGGVIDSFIRLVLNAGTVVLKFVNSGLVQFVIKTAALTAGLYGAIMAVEKLGVALTSLAFNHPILLGIAALAGALYGLSKVDESLVTIEDLNKEIEENNQKMATNISEIEALESKTSKLTETEEARLAILKAENEELEKQNKLNLERQGELLRKQESQSGKVVGYGTRGGGLGVDVQRESAFDVAKAQLAQAKSLRDLTEETEDYLDKLVQWATEAEANGITIDAETQAIIREYNALQQLKDAEQQRLATIDEKNRVTASALSTLEQENAELIKNWDAIQDLIAAEQQLRNGQALSESQIASLIAKYPALINNIDAMRNGELSAANAIHAVGVQSLGTSKTIIANSKKEAEAVVKSAQAQVDAYNAAMYARLKAGGSGVTMSSGMAEAVSLLNQAKAQLAMYSQAEYYGTAVTTGNTSATTKNTQAKQENTDAISEATNALKEQSNILGQAADLMISRLDDEISALEAQKQTIQDANQALEDQIELEKALDALAKAKSRKVLTYSGGQFVYSADATAVNEAQQRVNEIRRQQAQQAQLDAIDERIDAIKAEQDTWRAVKNAYDEYLGAQQLGVSAEGDAWKTRIGQAKDFAQQYLTIMQTLAGVESGEISLSQGKSILAKSKGFASSLPASTAYKSLLEAPITSGIGSATSAFGEQTVVNQYFGDISLPNVTNSTQFIEELGNYQQYAAQAATKR